MATITTLHSLPFCPPAASNCTFYLRPAIVFLLAKMLHRTCIEAKNIACFYVMNEPRDRSTGVAGVGRGNRKWCFMAEVQRIERCCESTVSRLNGEAEWNLLWFGGGVGCWPLRLFWFGFGRDGTNGMAISRFDQLSVFDLSGEVEDIIGFYMLDEEGVLQSVDISAKFVNGKPVGVEKYVMRTPKDWDRFMRFMERYSEANGFQFNKK